MAYTAGSVPFLNARPLVAWFESLGNETPVRVRYDLPSKLPVMLDSGQADVILVSSIEALTVAGRKAVAGVCIGSRGAAESVRLFSKVPFPRIRSLALDSSSMTSNALARIVLAEVSGCEPACSPMEPDLANMLSRCDAAVLIGDKGLLSHQDGLGVLDLGETWLEMTGLPFVWALWVGGKDLTKDLAAHLCAALDWAEANSDSVIAQAAIRSAVDPKLARRYLTETMNYRLEESDVAGLREFGRLIEKHGVAAKVDLPEFVGPRSVAVT